MYEKFAMEIFSKPYDMFIKTEFWKIIVTYICTIIIY